MTFRMHPAEVDSTSSMSVPSELSCGVCGHHALAEDTVHEFADMLGDRLICQVCGAHRVVR